MEATFLPPLRGALLKRAERVTDDWDPFVAAWLLYALRLDGAEGHPVFRGLLSRMREWLEGDPFEWERNLGAIGFCLWFLRGSLPTGLVERFGERVGVAIPRADLKWSVLRDPEQVFLMVLGIQAQAHALAGRILPVIRVQGGLGSLQRRVLYAASLRELGQPALPPDLPPAGVGDAIALAWWAERYGGDRERAWGHLVSLAHEIALDEGEVSDGRRLLRPSEMAVLYEAIHGSTRS